MKANSVKDKLKIRDEDLKRMKLLNERPVYDLLPLWSFVYCSSSFFDVCTVGYRSLSSLPLSCFIQPFRPRCPISCLAAILVGGTATWQLASHCHCLLSSALIVLFPSVKAHTHTHTCWDVSQIHVSAGKKFKSSFNVPNSRVWLAHTPHEQEVENTKVFFYALHLKNFLLARFLSQIRWAWSNEVNRLLLKLSQHMTHLLSSA